MRWRRCGSWCCNSRCKGSLVAAIHDDEPAMRTARARSRETRKHRSNDEFDAGSASVRRRSKTTTVRAARRLGMDALGERCRVQAGLRLAVSGFDHRRSSECRMIELATSRTIDAGQLISTSIATSSWSKAGDYSSRWTAISAVANVVAIRRDAAAINESRALQSVLEGIRADRSLLDRDAVSTIELQAHEGSHDRRPSSTRQIEQLPFPSHPSPSRSGSWRRWMS